MGRSEDGSMTAALLIVGGVAALMLLALAAGVAWWLFSRRVIRGIDDLSERRQQRDTMRGRTW